MHARLLPLALIAAAALVPGTAHATDGPLGSECRLVSVLPHPTATHYDGYLAGGPYSGNGVLTCSVQVGASAHNAPDAATVSGAVVAGPAPVSVPWTGAPMYVCTQFTPAGGVTNYWSGGAWSHDPNSSCTPYVDMVPGGDLAYFDMFICPVLQALAPGVPGVVIEPEGDTFVLGTFVWDCPPYGT